MTEKHDGKLTLGDTNVDLPRVEATVGNDGLSIGTVLRDTEAVTYDPGFMNTANARSAVTYIDGEAGILRYRGYPIEELAKNSSFLEVAYLLIYGELPTGDQLNEWDLNIREHTMLHEDIKDFFNGFPRNAHPMAICHLHLCALCLLCRRWTHSTKSRYTFHNRLMSKCRFLLHTYKKSIGQPFLYPITR